MNHSPSLPLIDPVTDFAQAIRQVDSLSPVAVSTRTGASYQPGIGPRTETQTVSLILAHLAEALPHRYASYRVGVPYADGTRQPCDVCLGGRDSSSVPWPGGNGGRARPTVTPLAQVSR